MSPITFNRSDLGAVMPFFGSQIANQVALAERLTNAPWLRYGEENTKEPIDLSGKASFQHLATDYYIEDNPDYWHWKILQNTHPDEATVFAADCVARNRPYHAAWRPVMRHIGTDEKQRTWTLSTRNFLPHFFVEANACCVTAAHLAALQAFLDNSILAQGPSNGRMPKDHDPFYSIVEVAQLRKYNTDDPAPQRHTDWRPWARRVLIATQEKKSLRNQRAISHIDVVYRTTVRDYQEHKQPYYRIFATLPCYIPMLRKIINEGPLPVFVDIPALSAEEAERVRIAGGMNDPIMQTRRWHDAMETPAPSSAEELDFRKAAYLDRLTYEDNVVFDTRFLVNKQVPGCNWLEVDLSRTSRIHIQTKKIEELLSQPSIEEKRGLVASVFGSNLDQEPYPASTTAMYEVHYDFDEVDEEKQPVQYHDPLTKLEWDSKLAPLRLLSFDIECGAMPDGSFPVPKVAKVIQIGLNVMTLDDKKIRNHIVLTLKNCTPVPDTEIYSFQTEQDLLRAFVWVCLAIDPDLCVGYNTDGFDFPYLFDRAKALDIGEQFDLLSRVVGSRVYSRETRLNSRAYGNNEVHETTMPGRISWDMFRWMKRNYKYRSYQLGAMAKEILKDDKVEMPYDQIEPHFQGTDDDRRLIAEYVRQDAFLPPAMMVKLETMAKEIEVCRVTGIQLHEIISRGAAIRVSRKMLGFMYKNGFLLPNERSLRSAPRGTYDAWVDRSRHVKELRVRHRNAKRSVEEAGMSSIDELYEKYKEKGVPKSSGGEDAEEVDDADQEEFEARWKKLERGEFDDGDDFNTFDNEDDGYQGAKVFDPIRGFYDEDLVATLDFSSLYPSIILAYNLCPTTLISHFKALVFDAKTLSVWLQNALKTRELRIQETQKWIQFLGQFVIKGHVTNDPDMIQRAQNGISNLLNLYELAVDAIQKIHPKIASYLENATQQSHNTQTVDAFLDEIYHHAEALNTARTSAIDMVSTLDATVVDDQAVQNLEALGKWLKTLEPSQDYTRTPVGHYFVKRHVREGLLPTILRDILAARKASQREMEKYPEGSREYENYNVRQLALKIIANSVYGWTGQRVSPAYCKEVAESVTAYGRCMIELVQKTMEMEFSRAYGYSFDTQVIYGDSVTGDTPVLIRYNKGTPVLCTIDSIRDVDWETQTTPWVNFDRTIKEQVSLEDRMIETWTDEGWTRLKRVIRHPVGKDIYRVNTHTGSVCVTADHSLLKEDGEVCKPSELDIGAKLMHHAYPPSLGNDSTIASVDEAFAMGFFFADGSCGKYGEGSNVKYTWAINKQDLNLLTLTMNKLNGLTNTERCGCNFKIIDTLESSGVYKLVAVGNPRLIVPKYRSLFYDPTTKLKVVPPAIIHGSQAVREAFWEGYYAGDGDKTGPGRRCDIKGQIGAAGMFWLLKTLGYNVSINTREDKDDIYRLTLSKHTMRRPATKVKKINLMKAAASEGTMVYDLETENHHFSAGVGELVVHNTDSVMIKIPMSAFCTCSDIKTKPHDKLCEHEHGCTVDPKVRDEIVNKVKPGLLAMQALFEKQGKHKQAQAAKDQAAACDTATGIECALLFGKVMARRATALFKDFPPINMEFEKIYFVYLLINKKRYCGFRWVIPNFNEEWIIKPPSKPDIKGLEAKRRDTMIYTANAMNDTLMTMLKTRSIDKAEEVAGRYIMNLRQNKFNLSEFVLSRQLNAWLADSKAPQAHVYLAERLRKKDPAAAPRLGDRVPYIIRATSSDKDPLYTLAENPIHAIENDISLNVNYYLNKKFLPPIARLFEVKYGSEDAAIKQLMSTKYNSAIIKPPISTRKGTLGAFFTKLVPKCSKCRKLDAEKDAILCIECAKETTSDAMEGIRSASTERYMDVYQSYKKCVSHCLISCQKRPDYTERIDAPEKNTSTIPDIEDLPAVMCTNYDCARLYERKKIQKQCRRELQDAQRMFQ